MQPTLRAADLLAAAGDAIVVADAGGRITFWNRAAERIFGFNETEALGQSLDLIIPERQRRRHWDGYAGVMKTGVTRYGADVLRVPALHKDGRRLSISFTVSLLFAPDGSAESIAAIIRDETQRWEDERALRKRLSELEDTVASIPAEDQSREGTIVDALAQLRARGFSAELRVRDGRLHVSPSGQSYRPSELAVIEVRRAEGITDPSDMAAVYAIAGPDGVRGVLVDAFGTYADPEIGAAIQRMRAPEAGSWKPAASELPRVEQDSLGAVAIPAGSYWGAQTQRALSNFAIGSQRMPAALIRALGIVKRAAAEVNRELGDLPEEKASAIARAAQEVADGKHDEAFPLFVWQSGSGTQTNMNANEVIANRASELLGGPIGAERLVHPNDDVNRSQSSNDVIPTALHVAAVQHLEAALRPALARLREALARKSAQLRDQVKMGRTHLMDAVPLTLGQEFSGYVAQLDECEERIARASAELLPLALGGSAVGTGFGTRAEFAPRACARIAAFTALPFTSHPNKFAALAAHDAVVSASGALRTLAVALFKIANDIRWLASGPRAGLSEISLPENEPGSSIMPGKVNPSQCEALMMVCIRVIGNDAAIAFAGAQGNFELNTCKPLLAHALLESLELLAGACRSFADRCVAGIEARPDRLRANVEASLMLVTALTPRIGYDAAARVARKAHTEGTSLREAAIALGVVTAAEFDALVRPGAMLGPGAGRA